jgi:FKBP-type peptidyl-prolyl cis-trans isomerase SlyD
VEIVKDAFVVIEYSVRLEDGSYVKGEPGRPASINFVAGYGQVLPGLEKRLLGLREGEETEFIIPAIEGFGEHDSKLVDERSFEEFPEGRDLLPGKWLVATNEATGASFTYLVKDKSERGVVLDHNHPLAGKALYYRVKAVRVRPALRDELEYLRPCEFQDESESGDGA